jgi:hypothetical protein
MEIGEPGKPRVYNFLVVGKLRPLPFQLKRIQPHPPLHSQAHPHQKSHTSPYKIVSKYPPLIQSISFRIIKKKIRKTPPNPLKYPDILSLPTQAKKRETCKEESVVR